VPGAIDHLEELISGKSHCLVGLNQSHGETFLGATSPISSIERDCGVVIVVEDAGLSIRGSISDVNRARAQVMRHLDATFPSEYMSVAMDLKALQHIGSVKSLSQIEQLTQSVLSQDPVRSCLCIRGSSTAVHSAVQLVKERLNQWSERHSVVQIDSIVLPRLLDKNNVVKTVETNLHRSGLLEPLCRTSKRRILAN
jgi:hypothetical protein